MCRGPTELRTFRDNHPIVIGDRAFVRCPVENAQGQYRIRVEDWIEPEDWLQDLSPGASPHPWYSFHGDRFIEDIFRQLLELRTLHDQYVHERFNTDPVNQTVRETYVPVYACPSDLDGARGRDVPGWGPGRSSCMNVPYQYGSYAGVSGRTTRVYLSASYGEWNHWGYFNYPPNYRGVFHVLMTTAPRWESLASVLDGTSSTLAVGEKHIPQQKDQMETFWAYSAALSTSMLSEMPPTLMVTEGRQACFAQFPPSGAPGHSAAGICGHNFGSYHPGIINWSLCDGSVRAISKDVDLNMLSDLATVANGEAAQVP